MKVVKHYIEYFCPGTFLDEVERVEVQKHEMTIPIAVNKATGIRQRYGSRPYAFSFVTKEYEKTVSGGKTCTSDPKLVKSGLHYLDGKVLTLEDIPDNYENSILRCNMLCNSIPAVVRTENGYRHTGILNEKDVVLQGTTVVATGKDLAASRSASGSAS